ncbi:MAG: HDIG domain-containing protein [Proteobacteria bacterium]|nr:HDIG domain-containing protein [Pseudomonadota bacterium]
MTDTSQIERAMGDRAKLAKVIQRRPRVHPVALILLSAAFALVATPVVMLDVLLIDSGLVEFKSGETAPITLRVATFSGFSNERFELHGGSVVLSFRQTIDSGSEELARAVTGRMQSGVSALAAYASVLFLVALLFTTQLRRSHRGRLVRTQLVTLAVLWVTLLAAKVVLLTTSVSVFSMPVAAVAMFSALTVDAAAGLATALMGSVVFGLAVPFDFGVFAVLGVQTAVPPLVLGDREHRLGHIALAGLLGGLAAAFTYGTLYFLSTGLSPIEPGALLYSVPVAALIGSAISAVLAMVLKPSHQFLLGEITRNKLVELEDLSNPLLKRIAENAPGTWQHSLAMANMAEIAANTIGANGRLVRVGAYYHDLGKSLQPKYFIENLEPGEASPHDRLPPEVSCDAIFAHVTEGIRLARKMGLPERIIDFMHMHHGDGLLEYFWAKCQESGNPHRLTAENFRYPGVPPQSRETAILAICDAVEAASRTLKNPDDQAVSKLVERIVYGKLHLGQLDESGLSMSDLRKISNSLRETIKHAHHGRIEYPWQREERARAQAESAAAGRPAASDRPSASQDAVVTATQRIISEPRLDSLDVPRPYWRDLQRPPAPAGPSSASIPTGQRQQLEIAATAQQGALPPAASRPEPGPDASRPGLAAAPASDPASDRPDDPSGAVSLPSIPARPDALPPVVTGTPVVAPPVVIGTPVAGPGPGQPAVSAGGTAGQSRPGASQPGAPGPRVAAAQPDIISRETTQPGLAPGPVVGPAAVQGGDDGQRPPATRQNSVPPPPPQATVSRRKQRGTIELMKDPLVPPAPQSPAPAGDDDDGLAPGTMVLGPPPATRPEIKSSPSGKSGQPTAATPPVAPVTIVPNNRSSSGKSSTSK